MDIKTVISQIAQDNLKDDSFFLVDVIVKGVTGKTKILILLDGDNGVTIDDCATLSRQVSLQLETDDLIDIPYILEVSSPGLDHPLTLDRQYQKNVGRKLKLVTREGHTLSGNLVGVMGTSLQFDKEVKNKKKVSYESIEVPLEDIEKANVLVSFK